MWYAFEGSAELLLADGGKRPFEMGDVVRFRDGDVHGLFNDSDREFVYLSVTAPPIDFGYAYRESSEDARA